MLSTIRSILSIVITILVIVDSVLVQLLKNAAASGAVT